MPVPVGATRWVTYVWRHMRRKIIAASSLVMVGLAIIFGVPTAYEGPQLLYISEQHAIRLVDAIGLAIAIPSWFYLGVIVLRLLARR